jgi:NAD(P)-dependent dehydrogenase (short-subunit alcohol dehydrogenase family)
VGVLGFAGFDVVSTAAEPTLIVRGVDETTTQSFHEWYVKRRKSPLARAEALGEGAGAVAFLASPECSYSTGQTLAVDAGLTSTF